MANDRSFPELLIVISSNEDILKRKPAVSKYHPLLNMKLRVYDLPTPEQCDLLISALQDIKRHYLTNYESSTL